jgi:RND family efflux transporter MFP subunit
MVIFHKQIIAILVAILCIVLAVIFNFSYTTEKNSLLSKESSGAISAEKEVVNGEEKVLSKEITTAKPFYPRVTFTYAFASKYSPVYKVNGQVNAQYELNLPSEVEGKIVKLNANFDVGNIVRKGTVLANIENFRYRELFTLAKKNVLEAKIFLAQKESESRQAKIDWDKLGNTGKASDLSLKIPNVNLAKLQLEAALIELEKAQDSLNDTMIVSPFDAVVEQRNVSVGAYVSSGMAIARLHSIESYKINLPLESTQWSTLAQPIKKAIKILSVAGSQGEWFSSSQVLESQIDKDTRQRNLVVKVSNPLDRHNKLFVGSFIEAEVLGKEINNLFKVPASAVTGDGVIWFIKGDETLSRHKVNIQFSKDGFVYVDAFESEEIRLITYPMYSFVIGQRVEAFENMEEDSEESE